ncbi:MAG: CarD family transcriptional regulator [Treponema sp.]|nr:MAG: CarD family transcriptional regulator [Treponema sp.]
MAKKSLFKTKQLVVYPGQGVGVVKDISDTEVGDEVIRYYVVYLADLDMTVLVPVDKSEELGLRSIISKKEAEKAIEFLSEEAVPMPTDWKMRYQMNMDRFKSGKIMEIAAVVKSLYHRSKIKELPIQERKLYEAAYRIFQDELVAALNLDQAATEERIHKALEPVTSENASDYVLDKVDGFDDDFDIDDSDDDFDEPNLD